jgi:hypothetical protein
VVRFKDNHNTITTSGRTILIALIFRLAVLRHDDIVKGTVWNMLFRFEDIRKTHPPHELSICSRVQCCFCLLCDIRDNSYRHLHGICTCSLL